MESWEILESIKVGKIMRIYRLLRLFKSTEYLLEGDQISNWIYFHQAHL